MYTNIEKVTDIINCLKLKQTDSFNIPGEDHPGQVGAQLPQLSVTWTPLLSTLTEHHELTCSLLVHSLYVTPWYWNGNTHRLLGMKPETVLQLLSI